jgi:hypothetical protein
VSWKWVGLEQELVWGGRWWCRSPSRVRVSPLFAMRVCAACHNTVCSFPLHSPCATVPLLPRARSVSVKIFRLFRCIQVEGSYWLVADMRLQCFTRQWWSYAVYALVMCVLYVVGLPLSIFLLLRQHRDTLFGPRSEATVKRLGFLYDAYGPTAWWWEIEELMRKLLLTAIAVLLDAGSPLQVRGREYLRAPSL